MSKFFNFLKAGYPILGIETHEEGRCIAQLSFEAKQYDIFSWDIIGGWKNHQKGEPDQIVDNSTSPVAPLEKAITLHETSIVFLKDYHRFLPSVDVYRTLKNMIPHLKAQDKHIVIVSPVIDLPTEIEKDVTILEFDLPSAETLIDIGARMVKDNDLQIEIDDAAKQAITSARGLTLDEAENAMALSLITTKTFSRSILEDAKMQAVRKSGLMELYMPESENQLGGVENLKRYIHNRKRGFTDPSLPTPRGILLTGLPGGGKSLSAKVIASILGFPLLRADFGSLKDSKVGGSEKKIRMMTRLADAIGEAVIWWDEIEKDLGGVASSDQTDGGTTSGMFGHLLTWMQETKSKIYIVATCNNIDALLNISQGALLRRFDDIFFVDVPSLLERQQILEIMVKKYGGEFDDGICKKMNNWTGAEIEKFVKASVYDGIDDAFNNVHPIFEQNSANIDKIRNWAAVNARLANVRDDLAKSNNKVRRLQVS